MDLTDEQLGELLGALPPAPEHLVESVLQIPDLAGETQAEPENEGDASETGADEAPEAGPPVDDPHDGSSPDEPVDTDGLDDQLL